MVTWTGVPEPTLKGSCTLVFHVIRSDLESPLRLDCLGGRPARLLLQGKDAWAWPKWDLCSYALIYSGTLRPKLAHNFLASYQPLFIYQKPPQEPALTV